MKTASDELKAKNNLPTDNGSNSTISQPGPEDGRDQNIHPGSSHTYEPKASTNKEINHNEEVHREGEAVNKYPKQ